MTVEALGHGQFKRASRFSIDSIIASCSRYATVHSISFLGKRTEMCANRGSQLEGGNILTVNSERLILGHLKNDG